jgi:hypothetical protein
MGGGLRYPLLEEEKPSNGDEYEYLRGIVDMGR